MRVCVLLNTELFFNFISQGSTYGNHECFTMEKLDGDCGCSISVCLAGIHVQGLDASQRFRS